jgi:hypothetical protein
LAKHILYNSSVVVNGVDLSDHVESVSYTEGLDGQRADAMSEIQKYEMPGLVNISDLTVNFYQDYAAAKVYATIHPLVTARSIFNVVIKADSGANAPTNPAFTLPVFVRNNPVFSGTHGDRHMTTVVFAPAGVQSVAIA